MTERLTDAELDALGKDANWDSRYGERAIAELRELREEVDACQRDCGNVQTVNELREQNAKLVAALERYGTHNHRVVGSDPRQVFECSALVFGDCDCGFDAALASAKGEQG